MKSAEMSTELLLDCITRIKNFLKEEYPQLSQTSLKIVEIKDHYILYAAHVVGCGSQNIRSGLTRLKLKYSLPQQDAIVFWEGDKKFQPYAEISKSEMLDKMSVVQEVVAAENEKHIDAEIRIKLIDALINLIKKTYEIADDDSLTIYKKMSEETSVHFFSRKDNHQLQIGLPSEFNKRCTATAVIPVQFDNSQKAPINEVKKLLEFLNINCKIVENKSPIFARHDQYYASRSDIYRYGQLLEIEFPEAREKRLEILDKIFYFDAEKFEEFCKQNNLTKNTVAYG